MNPPFTTEEKFDEFMNLSPFALIMLAVYAVITWKLRRKIAELGSRESRGA